MTTLSSCPPVRFRPRFTDRGPSGLLRRHLLVLAGAPVLAGVSACASGPAGPRHHDVSTERLLASLGRQFPMKREIWRGLEVSLGLPRLNLRPAENRIATLLDVGADERLLTRRQYAGTLGFSSGLRYEGSDHSVRLSEVKIEQFRIDALQAVLGSQANRLGAWIAQDLLEGLSVYRLPPSALEFAELLGVRPDGLQVRDDGLRILLAPARS